MIEKNVILFVRGEQQFDQGEPEVTELMTEGAMTLEEDGEITLTYQETELTGMAGTTTCFIVCGDRVELRRTGGINSQIIFQLGKRHSSLYETPWGTIQVDVATTALSHRLTSRGGVMDIRFSIAVDHQVTGENHFKVRVRESGR